MDHMQVLKRAWKLVWGYKALWIFGITLALTTVSWENRATSNTNIVRQEDKGDAASQEPKTEFGRELKREFDAVFGQTIEDLQAIDEGREGAEVNRRLVNTLIVGFLILLLLGILGRIARYVVETALIRMVNDNEESDRRYTVRQGFKLGWSREAWRLFLIDLLIDWPPAIIFFSLLILVLLNWAQGTADPSEGPAAAASVATSLSLLFLVICFRFVIGSLISFFMPFFRRAAVLDGLGVFASIRAGYSLVRQNLKDAGVMWLILAGLKMIWPLLMIPIVLLLIPVGGFSAVGAATLERGIYALFGRGDAALLWMMIAGIVTFILVLAAGLVFFGGLLVVFGSSSWTLTFRELRALQTLEQDDS